MNRDLCIGCYSFYVSQAVGQCLQASDDIKGDCPCAICLVKMICTVGCETYREFDDTGWNSPYE